MPNPGSLLDIREGRTKVDILGEVAEAEYENDDAPKLKDLNELIPASRGAISNNLSDLDEVGVLSKDDGRYTLDPDGLLELYREHVDSFLTRERRNGILYDETERVNEVRTEIKRRLPEVFDGNDLLVDILKVVLVDSRKAGWIRTIPDICYQADDIVRTVAFRVAANSEENEEDELRDVLCLAVSLEQTHAGLTRLAEREHGLQQYIPGTSPELTILNHINGDTN